MLCLTRNSLGYERYKILLTVNCGPLPVGLDELSGRFHEIEECSNVVHSAGYVEIVPEPVK